MSDTAFLINGIFKVLNFALFIGLCWYFFYTKMLASFLQKMHEQHMLIPKLEEQRRGLHNQESNIETAIEQQALVAKVLQKKIEGWAASHEKSVREHNEQNLHIQKLLAQKAQLQHEYLAKKIMYEKSVHEILAQTRTLLAEKYQNPAYAKKYIDTLLLPIKDAL